MFVRTKQKPHGKTAVQIVESYRTADKVSQKIIRHMGQAATEKEVEELKRLAEKIIVEMKNKRQPVLPYLPPENIYGKKAPKEVVGEKVDIMGLREEQRMVQGIGEVFGRLYEDLGLRKTLGDKRKDETWNGILEACVLARIANPASKHRTASMLEEDYGIRIALHKIYRMMDRLIEREEEVKETIAGSTLGLCGGRLEVLFFDVTTLYFESVDQDELRNFGFSKDCKFKETQVVLALVTTTEGLPVTYRVFPGNIYEGHTLVSMVAEIKKVYEVANVVLVADRAMFSRENLELMDAEGITFVVASRLKQLPNELKREILESEDFRLFAVDNELHWVKEFRRGERRLVVSYNAARAKKDAADRARLIERLMKKVKDGKVKIKDVIPNYGTKKYLTLRDKEACIDESKIEQDAQWDGLHGVLTNSDTMSPSEILARYSELWQIEKSFRINKHDLKMRPIYHWTPDRIQAHILICFIAYTLVRQAMYRVARQYQPMSFERIRNELLHAQASILVDTATKKRYLMPSKITPIQKKLYHIFGLKRSEAPRPMT
ncbi:MAG: IS1634 family transposase [Bryobacteraceae bacterium]